MDPLELLRDMQLVLERLNVPFAVVGSMASMLYGQPRMTNDADLVVDLKLEQVRPLCDAFGPPTYYVSEAAAKEAVRSRRQFNVIHNYVGFKFDLILCQASGWTRVQLDRVREVRPKPDLPVKVAAPEDVILGKLQYFKEGGSEKHIRDILAMFDVSKKKINRDDITAWSAKLGVAAEWQAVQQALDGPAST
jgi:hypothetical protein